MHTGDINCRTYCKNQNPELCIFDDFEYYLHHKKATQKPQRAGNKGVSDVALCDCEKHIFDLRGIGFAAEHRTHHRQKAEYPKGQHYTFKPFESKSQNIFLVIQIAHTTRQKEKQRHVIDKNEVVGYPPGFAEMP